jgi:hypothetical protein
LNPRSRRGFSLRVDMQRSGGCSRAGAEERGGRTRGGSSYPRPLVIDARSSASVRPSTRTTLSREVCPCTMVTRRAGTPARRATRRQSAALAAPSTGWRREANEHTAAAFAGDLVASRARDNAHLNLSHAGSAGREAMRQHQCDRAAAGLLAVQRRHTASRSLNRSGTEPAASRPAVRGTASAAASRAGRTAARPRGSRRRCGAHSRIHAKAQAKIVTDGRRHD